jgi:hypothetical protein
MSTSVDSANSILSLIYLAAAWADIAENDGSSPAVTLDIGLHTAAPATSSQSSNEATFGAYARVPVARSGAGWTTPSGGSLSNFALIQFAECTSGTNVITHVSVGKGGTIIHFGALGASRTVSAGIQPQFAANALVSTQT